MSTPFLVLTLISLTAAVVSATAVTAYVSHRGVKINYFLCQTMIFKYFNEYVAMTTKQKGRPGVWYYAFVVEMSLAAVFTVIGIAVK